MNMKLLFKPTDIDLDTFYCQINSDSQGLITEDVAFFCSVIIKYCQQKEETWINHCMNIFQYRWLDVNREQIRRKCGIDSDNFVIDRACWLINNYYIDVRITISGITKYHFLPKWYKMLLPYWNIIEGGYTKSAYFG